MGSAATSFGNCSRVRLKESSEAGSLGIQLEGWTESFWFWACAHFPHSPSYDPSLSFFQRIETIIPPCPPLQGEANHTLSQSNLIYSTGAYLMKFSIGTLPHPFIAIADTNSIIIWIQCQPCLQCINQSLPIFQPKSSSMRNCLYSEKYEDGSFTYGQMATDTFTLASTGRKTLSVPKITFRCGLKNNRIFSGIESGEKRKKNHRLEKRRSD
ncbi:hypothetical protein C2S52_008239 [Perilla frutescens var. hirtella]|nr:hypothetical protein C2S52_008239 [Perilla frutescens var. hirtella]